MIKNYRKKPVVIQALKLDENFSEVQDFVGGSVYLEDNEVYITTLEGEMHASLGDYIIKGVSGEFYPCKPDIFEMTYEAANE